MRELAKAEGLEVTGAFRCNGEQIDGGLKYEGENYLSKPSGMIDQPAQSLSMASLAKLKGRCTGGASVSINGFMPDPVAALTQGKAIKTVLVDGRI